MGTTAVREHNAAFLEIETEGAGRALTWPWPKGETATAVTFVGFEGRPVLSARLPEPGRRPKIFSVLELAAYSSS